MFAREYVRNVSTIIRTFANESINENVERQLVNFRKIRRRRAVIEITDETPVSRVSSYGFLARYTETHLYPLYDIVKNVSYRKRA